MAELVTPGRQHEFVVGIDFGHAETSACIFRIEWDVRDDMRKSLLDDVVLGKGTNERILVSAISRTKDGAIHIHRDAFKYVEGNNCRIGFKEKPQSLKGEKERLMVDYMRAVYLRVLRAREELDSDNHIVYIARPSGWQDARSKELYCEMAIEAGIPLAGLTSESRAAIFLARHPSLGFSANILNGALVFDLGSSTLDLTYLSKEAGPFDQGKNLGASIIDEVIFKRMILQENKQLAKFVQDYPEFADPLLYHARRFKEQVYGGEEGVIQPYSIFAEDILSEAPTSVSGLLKDIPAVRLKATSEELTHLVDDESGYRERLIHFLKEFKNNRIGKNPLYGVILVGGASRMYFLHDLILEALSIPDLRINGGLDPNLTVSRGIALLGAKDAISSVQYKVFKDSLPQRLSQSIKNDTIKQKLSEAISKFIMKHVKKRAGNWARSGEGYGKESFIKFVIKGSTISSDVIEEECVEIIRSLIKEKCVGIINDINNIISYYALEVRVSSDDLSLHGILPDNSFSFIAPLLKDVMPRIAERVSNNSVMDFLRHILGKDKKNRELMSEKLSNGGDLPIKEIIDSAVVLELTKVDLNSITNHIQSSIYEMMDRKLKEVRIPIE